MDSGYSVIDDFVRKWNTNESTEKASSEEISRVERELGISLPKSYKYLACTYGNLVTPDILEAIVDKELDLCDVQNFELPSQALKDTKTWREAGLPSGYYAFASDCMGNMYCFRSSECQNEAIEPAVWFFDHDFIEIEVVSDNLSSWLEEYNGI